MTELIWDGKYDANGKKIAPVRIDLPFQNIETVNESAEDRKHSYDIFSKGGETEWRNRLIWGDKKYVLPSLMPEFAGKVNLIYIDPPFDTGANFSYTAQIPDVPDDEEDESLTFTKQPSMIETKAYRDTWGRGMDGYMQWFYESAILLRELLAENGTLYVHLDWHIGHFVKVVLDEVFGHDRFLNEVVWSYFAFKRKTSRKFPMKHDTIMSWTKTDQYLWNTQFKSHKEEYLKRWKKREPDKRRRPDNLPR